MSGSGAGSLRLSRQPVVWGPARDRARPLRRLRSVRPHELNPAATRRCYDVHALDITRHFPPLLLRVLHLPPLSCATAQCPPFVAGSTVHVSLALRYDLSEALSLPYILRPCTDNEKKRVSLERMYLFLLLACVLIQISCYFFLMRLPLFVYIHQPVSIAILSVGVVWTTPFVRHAHHASVKRHR